MAHPSSSKDRIDSAHHQIHHALAPRIAVLQTGDVAETLSPNGFEELATCLRPFEESVRGVTVRTSQLESKQCPTFPVQFEPLSTFAAQDRRSHSGGNGNEDEDEGTCDRSFRPGEILDRISAHTLASSRAKSWQNLAPQLDPLDPSQLAQLQHSPIEDVAPWFTDARDLVLSTRSITRHETFGHPAAVILAVSNRSPDPMNAFASLYAATQPEACEAFTSRPYVDPNVLRYYVLVHDSSQGTDIEESKILLDSIKKLYGLNCCILILNSNSSPSPEISDLWSTSLSSGRSRAASSPYASLFDGEDVKRLRAFVRELVAQSLIPWMERSVGLWNESVIASRKGVAGRLFGAGRKFFASGTGSSAGKGEKQGWNPQGGYYLPTSLESQTRRLADFAFLIRDYKLAASHYDVIRKDFVGDKAYRHAAAATEMFGLAHLMMMLASRASPIDVDSYLAGAAQLHRSAAIDPAGDSCLLEPLRAVLLYYEAYRALEFYRPAPAALLRVAGANGEASAGADLEVMSAMLIEQAALASLRLDAQRPALRKWAFYLIMAGHRYGQSGAKMLCQRAFGQARGVYLNLRRPRRKEFGEDDGDGGNEDKGAAAAEQDDQDQQSNNGFEWALIRSHVEHELGKQALNDGRAEDAVEHLLETLRPLPGISTTLSEEMPDAFASTHSSYFRDFLAAYGSATAASGAADQAELELPHPLVDLSHTCIQRMQSNASSVSEGPEWLALETAFTASQQGSSKAVSSLAPTENLAISQDKAFALEVCIENPLCIPLSISDLCTSFTSPDSTASGSGVVADAEIATRQIELQPRERKTLHLVHHCPTVGRYRAASISYRLAGQVPIVQPLNKRGARLNATVQQRRSKVAQYGEDQSLVIEVRPPHPELEVELVDCAEKVEMGLGEEREVTMRLKNTGKAGLRGLVILSDRAEAVQIADAASASPPSSEGSSQEEEMTISNALTPSSPASLLATDATLAPGECTERRLLLRGASLGNIHLHLLFVFQLASDTVAASSTLFGKARYELTLHVQPVLDIGVEISPSREGFAYSLAISALNLTPQREPIDVTNVAFLSPRWRCDHKASSLPAHETLANLPPGQVVTAYVNIAESSDEGVRKSCGGVTMDHTIRQLRAQIAARDIDRNARPGEVMLQLSSSSMISSSNKQQEARTNLLNAARTAWRETSVAREFPTIPSLEDRRRIFPLYQPEDLDVVVEWQLPSISEGAPARRGRVFIFGLSLGPGIDTVRQLFIDSSQSNASVSANSEASAAIAEANSARKKITGQESQGQGHGRSMYEETDKQRAALVRNLRESALANEEDPLVVDIDVTSTDSTAPSSSRFVPVIFRVRNMSTTRSARCTIDLDAAVESDVDIAGAVAAAAPSQQQGDAGHPNTTPVRKAAWVGRLTLRSSDADGHRGAGGLIKPRETILLRALAERGTTTGGGEGFDWELGDWSIKVDVYAAEGQDEAIAHFNSGRLRSGRLLPRAGASTVDRKVEKPAA